jgi:adenylate cyclase
VIVGAMGSKDRMDYTVLGDHVNLAARLCSHAQAGQTLVTASAYAAIADCPEFAAEALTPIAVKGKREPVPVYQIGPAPGAAEPRLRASA